MLIFSRCDAQKRGPLLQPSKIFSNGCETFTFTLNCHLGNKHSQRSRGDTTWKAQGLAVKHTTRTLSGPPSTRTAIAMDGGVADTACYYTGR